MQASELRIGNYVTIDNPMAWPRMKDIPLMVIGTALRADDDFTVSTGSVKLQSIEPNQYFNQFDEFIKPIPMTEEWLVRFGLKLKSVSKWASAYNDIKRTDKLYAQSIFDDNQIDVTVIMDVEEREIRRIGIDSSVGHGTMNIEHVHTFQNLWFALTGEELKVDKRY